ncbi:MAG: CGGC domain-containing protein [Calditrichaeota bacterium]|jgi:predicted metal-binding protein|nr:CGGC domain-containing protein [Calditrichota bacterium]MBT7618758.1 CGGC domain-containing protein [Calditrichota bacterium]MBT7787620.1 CGGC domain-containing protein [Calditrichota bacterium]
MKKKKIAIFFCKRIKDHTCIACAKCFKAIPLKNGKFANHEEEIEVVAMTDCGDCPGLAMPRVPMICKVVEGLGNQVDAIHFGTCVTLAKEHGECPLDLDALKGKLEAKLNIPVILGTHDYI